MTELDPLLRRIQAALAVRQSSAWRTGIPTRLVPQMPHWIATMERRLGCVICAEDLRIGKLQTEIIVSVRVGTRAVMA